MHEKSFLQFFVTSFAVMSLCTIRTSKSVCLRQTVMLRIIRCAKRTVSTLLEYAMAFALFSLCGLKKPRIFFEHATERRRIRMGSMETCRMLRKGISRIHFEKSHVFSFIKFWFSTKHLFWAHFGALCLKNAFADENFYMFTSFFHSHIL